MALLFYKMCTSNFVASESVVETVEMGDLEFSITYIDAESFIARETVHSSLSGEDLFLQNCILRNLM